MKTKIFLVTFLFVLTHGTMLGQGNEREALAKDYYEKSEGRPYNGYLQKSADLGPLNSFLF